MHQYSQHATDTYPGKLKQLHPCVLADRPVVMLLQELTPVINVLPTPVVFIQQAPHCHGSVQLQALLTFLQEGQGTGNLGLKTGLCRQRV